MLSRTRTLRSGTSISMSTLSVTAPSFARPGARVMRSLSIFGATGSVGEQTVDLIRRDAGGYRVVALTGGRNLARLAEMARALQAEVAVTA